MSSHKLEKAGEGSVRWTDLFGIFEVTERDRRLHKYAERYCIETESYDRMVCTGPIREGARMPACPLQAALITRNAIAVRKRIAFEAERDGFTHEDLRRAISKWHEMTPNAHAQPTTCRSKAEAGRSAAAQC